MTPRLLALCVAGLALGCGGGSAIAPVAGTVTLDGKPLPSAYVNFQPVGTADNPNPGTGSYAVTDDKGRYTLRMTENGSAGAVVGTHKVTIALQFAEDVRGGPDTGTPDGTSGLPRLGKVKQIPPEYNERSQLTFVVPPGGTATADFPLLSKPNAAR